jgi:UDP-2-acetamido-3-amino-2,3-dideoxy-glucuronate N-acetyltransferase
MQKKDYFKHDSVYIDEGAKIGDGTKVWHHSHIMPTAIVGKNCIIGQNCFIAGIIGDNCKLQNNVNVYEGVEIEDWVFCGPSMTFTNDMNPRAKYPKNGRYIKTKVKEGASIGANATIVCDVEIGQWSFIGAGSVVTKNIPDYAIVYGNPAKIKGWVCECGNKLPNEFNQTKCKLCGKKYQKIGLVVSESK